MLIRHPDSARGDDLYETPEVATLALLRAEALLRTIWEPACGPGAIVRVLRDTGHRVIATDLIDYHSANQDHAGGDFLLERGAPDGVEMIVTNPPGKLASQFAAHALSLCPRVAMLLRLSFLESGNEKTKAGRAAMIRRTLPQRRAAETFDMRFWNQPFTVTVGFYADGTLGEVFIDTGKSGADLAHVARDAALVISLALQHGVSIDAIRHAVTRNGSEPASILGAVVDRISADSFLGGTR